MNGSHRPLTRPCRHRHRPDHWTRRLTPSPPRVTEPLATLQSVLASLLASKPRLPPSCARLAICLERLRGARGRLSSRRRRLHRSRGTDRQHPRGLRTTHVVHDPARVRLATARMCVTLARVGLSTRRCARYTSPCAPPHVRSRAFTRQVTRFHMIGRRMERRLAHIFAPLSDLCRPLPDIPREPSTCIVWSAGSRTVSTSSRAVRPRPRAVHSAARPVESDIRTPLARSRRVRNNAREARTRSRTSAPDPRRRRRS